MAIYPEIPNAGEVRMSGPYIRREILPEIVFWYSVIDFWTDAQQFTCTSEHLNGWAPIHLSI